MADLASDLSRTLEQLERVVWGEPEFPSHLVVTCHALRRKPLSDFTVEDLRIMIGQGMSLIHLMPLAIQRLTLDPLAEGDYYPGDLLKNVAEVTPEFWRAHPDLRRAMDAIVRQAQPLPPGLDLAWAPGADLR